MKKFIVPSLVILGIALVAIVLLLDLRFPYLSFEPEPITISDTLLFHDTESPYISYNFQIKTTVFYKTPLWFWNREELCDSVHAFNTRLMNRRFEGVAP